MFKSKMLIFVIGLTLLTTSIGLAQVTKQNAIDTVLMNICGLDTTNFNVFMEPNVFNDDWFFLNLTDSLQNPYNYSWCFFIDENPNYHWSHDCSYLFLDTISGSYSRISHHFYPYNYKAEMEEVLLNFEDTTTWPVIQNPTVGVSNVSPDPNKYAVFICGDNYNPTPPYENFRWNNLSHMFSALKNDYGFTDENIFVFVPPLNTWEEDLDNDDVDDFDDACNLDNIDDTFEYLDEEMDEDDLLFVFGTSHGHSDMISESYLILEVGIAITEKLYDTDLAEMVEGINCLQKIFVIDACFSGGFVDDLYGPKSSVQTCISVDKGITMAQNFGYTKLPYAYGTALKGYHPEGGQPWINSEYEIGEADLGDIYGPWDDLDDINPDEAEGLSINDGNQDGYIQLGETFEYCRYLDYEIFNYGENHINHGFDDADDLLTCAGLCGIVTETQTVEGNFIIGKNLSVSEAVTLTIDDYSKFFLNYSVSFNIVEGGEVEINDNVEFWGFGETSVFEIYGDASFGSNFSLKAPTELTWTGVKFINESTDYTVAGATIENCTLFGNCKSLEVDGCTFNNAKLEIAYGDLTVDNNSEFNTSWIYAGHPNDGHSSVIIDNCDFDNSSLENLVSIDIDDYFSYKITDCSIIDNADGPCISLYNAGSIRTSTTEEDDIIKNCTIRSTSGIRDDYPSSGVQIYTSYCTLDSNWIYNNDHGVRCLNNSSIEIIGYENSSAEHETQRIKNNDEVQVFSTENSFPTTFTYNSISGPQDSWYVYTSTSACTTAIFDIDYNYWGGLDCTELEDYLHPDGCYKCDNVWDPSWAKKNFDIVKAKYDSVTTLIDSGLYSDAESQLKMIIYDYPESKFASAAVKDLFYLKEIHDQDYSGLQTYYDTAVNLQNEDELDKLSKFFANRCDIKLENYQNAIDWYDAIILNPDTLEDSVFAVIDRDYVTMLMQMDSSRKGIIIPDYPGKPVSYDEFMIKREELLKLLTVPLYTPYGIEESNENEFVDSNIDFIGNYPNPFHTKTTFSFNLKNEARVKIQIFNQLGMMVSEVTDGLLKEGEHNIQFFNTTLSPGIYILKLTMNELYTIGKKIIIY